MRKLTLPPNDPVDVYDLCVAEVTDIAVRSAYVSNRNHMTTAAGDFASASAAKSWASLPRVARGNPGAVIIGTLTKKSLNDLYSAYMVQAKGPSRKVYDDIMVAAKGLCPFCAGLGQVHTLDHYLPKANFPAHSVSPANLVPCCRDCNTGKGSSFGAANVDQTLHPYFDADQFFQQRWIFGRLTTAKPLVMEYICRPPDAWPAVDRQRAVRHFEDYDIASRFELQAGGELTRIVASRAGILSRLTPADYRSYLLENAQGSGADLNGWSRTMYAALAVDNWFCQTDFTDPNWLPPVLAAIPAPNSG
ncbi:HNH endonuclease [Ancylobacter defluvii]|uniref:HNH endonuclease n=1 Tax=Ancylobacter defluvii TaxID=1282440 RepID=A0A9W6N9Q1_9HYPH|nr:hypothetical protein [Ancylobacter defluvii]MBS7590193.1 hypothetical protein [Ancylobacter defluvii]GLK82828.1 hypothetical protein GCM10017653_08970 [Ancylobacter defluvii]